MFENVTYPTPNITDAKGMFEYANEVTQFHNYGAFGIMLVFIFWIFSFKLASYATDKADMVASFLTATFAVLLWSVGIIEASIMYITIILMIISIIVSIIS